jgi:predicted alpha/beta hydrolase family esterase
MILAVFFAGMSAVLHTHVHFLSQAFLIVFAILAFFVFVKLVNAIAPIFPRRLEVAIHWVHAMVFELAALAVMLLLHIYSHTKNFQKPAGCSEGRPILLVHGYFNDSSAQSYLKYALGKEKIGPVYTVDLGFPFRSLFDYALKVKEKLAQIARETGRSDVILVGHSMGGLVSSLYATQFAPPKTVTDVITIGSPLAGTHVAKIGIGPNAREMERSSSLIATLNGKIRNETFTRFYHIGTNTDQLIIPAQSALIGNHPSREFLFEDIGHASMVFSPRVASLIVSWLTP